MGGVRRAARPVADKQGAVLAEPDTSSPKMGYMVYQRPLAAEVYYRLGDYQTALSLLTLPRTLGAVAQPDGARLHRRADGRSYAARSRAPAGAARREERLRELAIELGYEYLVFCDHSQSLRVANGLSPERLKKKMEAVRKADEGYGEIHLLCGSEVDILRDGSLDYDDDVLAGVVRHRRIQHRGIEDRVRTDQAQRTRDRVAVLPDDACAAHQILALGVVVRAPGRSGARRLPSGRQPRGSATSTAGKAVRGGARQKSLGEPCPAVPSAPAHPPAASFSRSR